MGRSLYGIESMQVGELPLRRAVDRVGFQLKFDIVSEKNFDSVLSEVKKADRISLDTETTGLDFERNEVVGFSFCYGKTSYYVVLNHVNRKAVLDREMANELLRNILEKKMIYLFNAIFDLRMIKIHFPSAFSFLNWDGIVDVQSLCFLVDTNILMPSLKSEAHYWLGIQPPKFDEVVGEDIIKADLASLAHYGAFDAYTTYHIGELLFPVLSQYYGFVVGLDRKIIRPVMEAEETEFLVDREYIQNLYEFTEKKIESYSAKVYEEYGEYLNLNSDVQVRNKLLSLGYTTGMQTPKGAMSVKKEALEKLRGVPLADWSLEYKHYTKLLSSYIKPVMGRLDIKRPVRFRYLLSEVPTYRFASAGDGVKVKNKDKNQGYFINMNFQSVIKDHVTEKELMYCPEDIDWQWDPIPEDYESAEVNQVDYLVGRVETQEPNSFRKVFKAPDGYVWLSTDFSGQELRIAANYSKEMVWVNAFLSGDDIHRITAEAIWGKESYNKDYRKKAKIANFLCLYGGSAYAMAPKLGLTQKEAEDFLKNYWKSLPQLARWVEDVHRRSRRDGYVLSDYRLPRRTGWFYRQGSMKQSSFGDRTAANTLIQSSGAVIMRIAFIKQWEQLRPKYKDAIQFRGTIHDEFNWVVRKDVLAEFMEDQRKLMVNTTPKHWLVPMDVSFEIGSAWGETFAVHLEKGRIIPDFLDGGGEIDRDEDVMDLVEGEDY